MLAGFSQLLILKKLVIPARVQVQLKFARFCVSQAWERRKLCVHFSLLNGLVTKAMKKQSSTVSSVVLRKQNC